MRGASFGRSLWRFGQKGALAGPRQRGAFTDPPRHPECHSPILGALVLCCASLLLWGVALLSSWWRWAGHAARLADRFPDKWLAQALAWRDAWFREAMRGLHWRSADLDRHRLGRGLRGQGRRRWDDYLQAVVDSVEPGTRRKQHKTERYGRAWLPGSSDERFVYGPRAPSLMADSGPG